MALALSENVMRAARENFADVLALGQFEQLGYAKCGFPNSTVYRRPGCDLAGDYIDADLNLINLHKWTQAQKENCVVRLREFVARDSCMAFRLRPDPCDDGSWSFYAILYVRRPVVLG